ncbi:hypothetical protein ACQE3D_10210 [Methylomonas sp. MS20]|uniref:hypothetical protein n=1 Tax=unclassified Methylomonas TaxID=2608980 RepID=UPI0028A489C6|nr:hypothetical protein [Methylomonas sp. MV1]MDT4328630.1 hypothetical protein [Methylomonas sp. MV1]
MCGKFGGNEAESLQNMMSMAVQLVIADTFDLDVDDVSLDSELQNDLGMDTDLRDKLDSSVMEMFNELHLDFSRIKTVADVVKQVVTLH